MVEKTLCGHEEVWHNCYLGFFDLLSPESVAHPAKQAPALCFRIFDHLKELGLIDENSTILDFMAGTGMTGLVAGTLGLKSVMVELEGKFVEFQKANKTYLEKKLGREIPMTIIQGDARQLSKLLHERGLVGITSPPYGETSQDRKDLGERQDKLAQYMRRERPNTYRTTGAGASNRGYSSNPENIGNLKDKPMIGITSPPYEAQSGGKGEASRNSTPDRKMIDRMAGSIIGGLGETEGQIGKEQGATYLSEMEKVYSEAAKVANVLVLVTKNPTRSGKLRRLDLDTISLLESTGWKLLCHHKAILFEETEQGHLFEGKVKKPRGRLSFFKRLAYQKGSPVAQWEDVLFAVREGEGVCAITSPPYQMGEGDNIWNRNSQVVAKSYAVPDSKQKKRGYGSTPGQIGNLK